MGLEIIEAIVKKDNGQIVMSCWGHAVPPHFKCCMSCKFGDLRVETPTIEEGLKMLADRYYSLDPTDYDALAKDMSL